MLAVRLIEQVGAYAGIAAIPGLAVLSALYFSQARDVKRLREWAGRAPERAAEQAAGGRVAVPGVAAQPSAAQPAGAAPGAPPVPQPAAPAAAPAGGAPANKPAVTPGGARPAIAAAAAGAQAATASGPEAAAGETATPGAANANGEGPAEPAKAGADKPAALTPAAVASAAAAKAPAGSPTTGGAGGGAARTGPPAVGGGRPTTAGSPVARKPIPRMPSSQTSVLTPTSTPRESSYRRFAARLPAGRYVALIVAGALVLGGGAAYGISQLASSDGGGGKSGSSGSSSSGGATKSGSPTKTDQNVTSRPAVNPADVTVTVVNGTTIPNLARDTASKLSGLGFQIGNKVTGSGPLAAAESVVEYKPGAEDEARYVAAKLDIGQKQPADSDALAQAGAATVIVVLGADQAPGG